MLLFVKLNYSKLKLTLITDFLTLFTYICLIILKFYDSNYCMKPIRQSKNSELINMNQCALHYSSTFRCWQFYCDHASRKIVYESLQCYLYMKATTMLANCWPTLQNQLSKRCKEKSCNIKIRKFLLAVFHKSKFTFSQWLGKLSQWSKILLCVAYLYPIKLIFNVSGTWFKFSSIDVTNILSI